MSGSYTDIGGIVASLRVLDEFTAPIAAVLDQLAELEDGLARVKAAGAGMSSPFTRLSAAIAKTEGPLSEMAARLDGLDAPIAAAADRLMAVQDRTAAIAAESAAAARNFASIGKIRVPASPVASSLAGAGGGAGRGGGRGGGAEEAGGGFLAGRFSKMGDRALSIPGLATGASVYESLKAAMSENLSLTQALTAFNVQGATPAQRQQYLGLLHALARQSAMGTIYTEQETARAMLGAAQMAGFTGQRGIAQFANVFPIALRMAEVGQMQGLGSIAANIKAAIGYAHLTGRYDPTSLMKGLDEVLAIAERTNTSIAATETTMKYGIPLAVAGGANVDRAADVIGFLMRAGLGRSAGYSVGMMIQGILTSGGPINAQLAAEREKVRQALGEHAPQFQNITAHVAALRDLGIMNAAGHLTVLNKRGGIDLEKVMADIERYGSAHKPADLADVLYAAFGMRGMRGAALVALQKGNFAAFEKLIAGTPGAAEQQATFAQTPLQEFEQMLARLQDIGNVLGTTVLPDFTQLETGLVEFLDALDKFISHHKFLASVLGHAAVGAVAGYFTAGPPGAVVGATAGATSAVVSNLEQPIHPTHGPLTRLLPQSAPPTPPTLLLPPPPTPPNVTVEIHAPLTVQGNLLSTEAEIDALLDDWWRGHAGQITATVKQAITATQQRQRRQTLQDHGDASTVNLGGFAMGGL